MESFTSEAHYLKELESRAALPEGFRCSTAAITFFPRERAVARALPMNLSLILAEKETPDFAAVFTRNQFPGAPVRIGRRRLAEPAIRGILINNKVANVGTPRGEADAEELLGSLGGLLHVPPERLFAASTGIIGWELPRSEMAAAFPGLVAGQGAAGSAGSILPVARAIMTTDAFPKVRRAAAGRGTILGIAKGAGMIEPNMATLLCVLLTDCAVPREVLREELAWCVDRTLNRISVDGDQSTSDSAFLLASGLRGPVERSELRRGLQEVLAGLAFDVMRNAEGMGHVMRVSVRGARDEAAAVSVAKAIANSPLVKTAIFGNDPNVGRIVSAIGDHLGNAGETLDLGRIRVTMGGVEIFCAGGFRLDADKEDTLNAYLKDRAFDTKRVAWPQHERTVDIDVTMDGGSPAVEVLGSDLSYDYVRENADYRS